MEEIGTKFVSKCLELEKNRELLFRRFFNIERHAAFLQFIDDDIVEKFLKTTKEDMYIKFDLYLKKSEEHAYRCCLVTGSASDLCYRELRFFNKIIDVSDIKKTFSIEFSKYVRTYVRFNMEDEKIYLAKLLCAMFLSEKYFRHVVDEYTSIQERKDLCHLIYLIYYNYIENYPYYRNYYKNLDDDWV